MGGVRHISRYLWQAKYRRSRFKLIENVRTRIYHLQISEQSPSSYHRRRCKDPRLCCRLAARVSFCQHWPVQLLDWPRSGSEHSKQCSNTNLNFCSGFGSTKSSNPNLKGGSGSGSEWTLTFGSEPNILGIQVRQGIILFFFWYRKSKSYIIHAT